jgi:hypothetical protein
LLDDRCHPHVITPSLFHPFTSTMSLYQGERSNAVLLLFLLFQTSRISASPHPFPFMQQRPFRSLGSHDWFMEFDGPPLSRKRTASRSTLGFRKRLRDDSQQQSKRDGKEDLAGPALQRQGPRAGKARQARRNIGSGGLIKKMIEEGRKEADQLLPDLLQERMRAHNQRYAHGFLRLFIFVQKATLRFFNNHPLRALVYCLQAKLS